MTDYRLNEFMFPPLLRGSDFLTVPFLLVCLLFLSYIFISRFKLGSTRRLVFIALFCKLLFVALRIFLLFEVYDGKSDTTTYYRGANILHHVFQYSPDAALDIIFSRVENLGLEASTIVYSTKDAMLQVDHSPGMVARTAGLFTFFIGNSFLLLSVTFSILAFIGSFLSIAPFMRLFPEARYYLAATLFVPSILYWGNLMSKDSLMIFGLGLLTYGFFSPWRSRFVRLLLVCCGAFILYLIKAYVLVVFVFTYFLNRCIHAIKIREVLLSYFIKICFVLTAVVLLIGSLQVVKSYYAKANPDVILDRAERMIEGIDKGESQYKVPGFSLTPVGVVLGSGGAILTSFFRPFIWETKKVVYLPSVIEGMITFIILIIVMRRTVRLKVFGSLFMNERALSFCIIYALSFAIIAGLFSFTFGSLVRYKIPSLVFLFVALAIMYKKSLLVANCKYRSL